MARMDQLHEQVFDLLGAYALGTATLAERELVERHLPRCPACQQELARLRLVTDALALAAEERTPSPQLRERLAASALSAGQEQPQPRHPTAHWWANPVLAWAVAACLLLVSVSLLVWNVRLRAQLVGETFPLVTATGEHVGVVQYLPNQHVLVLRIDALPPPPPGQVYQVWGIRDGEPVPTTVFRESHAQVAMTGSPSTYQLVAITLEPGPLGSPQPTSQPLAIVKLAASGRT